MSNKEFNQSIDNATFKIIQEVSKNLRKACLLVEADAKKNCPVDMGYLRASMFSNVKIESNELIGFITNNSSYAPYVHNGTGIYAKDGTGRKTPWGYVVKSGKYKGYHFTVGQKPNPFLEKARDKNRDKILKLLGGK
ncbi:HK97-gp10 family putative phage morphogenesis protein [Clostridium cylindrosporum]|uniref:Phage protein, HK97 gp10 family n=1 Tax=Clostridium cylindrosporum DSM 605 TaxID=1121307 RepID=A0A0J8DBB1_CLOCY|nr:HK97-gp10 family putative phage morphogenesis protein [Clostridium cylindrosporum]KMT21594.1 phage protein, HK97 gp10 family [Clostridium cylindrosporum DSM 605]